MKAKQLIVPVVRGGESIDVARHQRDQEPHARQLLVSAINKVTQKIAGSGRQPIVLILLSEGATSLAFWEKWGPEILETITQYEAFPIIMLNIGRKVKTLYEKNREEFEKRRGAISNITENKASPPLIFTTNTLWKENQLISDENLFDQNLCRIIYIFDRLSVSHPVKDELPNLLKQGVTYTVSTPMVWVSYADFTTQCERASLMFAGQITGKETAKLTKDSLDGLVVLSTSETAVHDFCPAFAGEYPGCRVVAYAYKGKSKRIPFIPKVSRIQQRTVWAQHKLYGFFVIEISRKDIEEAIQKVLEPN